MTRRAGWLVQRPLYSPFVHCAHSLPLTSVCVSFSDCIFLFFSGSLISFVICLLCCSCSSAAAAEFGAYFECVRSLRFDEQPDYARLRAILRGLFQRKGFSDDNRFDWTIGHPP